MAEDVLEPKLPDTHEHIGSITCKDVVLDGKFCLDELRMVVAYMEYLCVFEGYK